MGFTLIGITFFSLALAAVMAAVAWRVAREEARRSEARVAALGRDIQEDDDLPLGARTPVVTSAELFSGSEPERPRGRVAAALGFSVLIVCGAIVAIYVVSGIVRPAPRLPTPTPALAPPAQADDVRRADRTAAPLELTTLTHEREADRLTVRGTVRNPAAGAELDHVSAVVSLFDRDGALIGTGRSAIDAAALAPGDASSFTVTVPAGGDLQRYRVSFRRDDRVVPHVDRREPLAEARSR